MTINFNRDIRPLYARRVAADPAYQQIVEERTNEGFEQNLLTLVEVTKSFMSQLTSPEQARAFHYTMDRMLATTPFRGFDNIKAAVCGNVENPHLLAESGDQVFIISDGSEDVVSLLFRVPPATMDDYVELINERINAGVARAVNDKGRLCFTSPSGSAFTLVAPKRGGGSILAKAGISEGEYAGPIESASCQARDDAIAHIQRVGSPESIADDVDVIEIDFPDGDIDFDFDIRDLDRDVARQVVT